MVSMRLGAIISFLGAAVALIPAIYFLTLPLNSPTRELFIQPMLGIPFILYFTIAGAIVTLLGLILFIRAARAPPEAAYPRVVRQPAPVRIEAPRRPVRSRPRPRPTSPSEGEIVAEIEREIEEIVQSGEAVAEKPVEEEEAEERPVIEVVNKGQDMVCPHCGALNPLKSTKCAKCKKKLYTLKEGEPSCPICGAPLRLSKRISEDLFTCGLCFSELRIPQEIRDQLSLQ